MYSPHYTYTDKLVLEITKLENARITTVQNNLSNPIRKKLIDNSKANSIFQIARTLGQEFSIGDSTKILHGIKSLNIVDSEEHRLLKNYIDAVNFITSEESESFPEFDKSTITALSKIILDTWKEPWLAEEFRNFNDKIDERWDSFLSLRDQNIIGQQVEGMMGELIEWYKNATPTVAPIVRIAIVIHRFIEIAPFIGANKIVMLAVTNLLLYKNGFSYKLFSSAEKAINKAEDKLLKAFVQSKQSGDLVHWIEAFVEAVSEDLKAVREEMSEFIEKDEKSKEQPFLDLNKRQLKVLRYLQKVPFIKREDYCHTMEVSTMTAYRDLTDLVDKKLIKIDGQGRGTRYKLGIN